MLNHKWEGENMIFIKEKRPSKPKIHLIKSLLERLIGKTKEECIEIAEKNGFIFLDSWGNKVGFAKENTKEEWILSLLFNEEDGKCNFYRLISRDPDQHWKEGQFLDYHLVRDTGIVASALALALEFAICIAAEPAFHSLYS